MNISEKLINNPHIRFKPLDESFMDDRVIFFQDHAVAIMQGKDTYVLILNNYFDASTYPHKYSDFIEQYLPNCQFLSERLHESLKSFYENVIVSIGELLKTSPLGIGNICKTGISLFFDADTQELKEIKIPILLQIENNISLKISTLIDKDYKITFSIVKNKEIYNNMDKINNQFLNIICIKDIQTIITDYFFDYTAEDVVRFKQLLSIIKY